MKSATLLSLLCAGLSCMTAWAQGTYTASTCNFADVNGLINGPIHTAVNGDTINIPAGSCQWVSTLTVTGRGISIIGAGQGTTTITSSVAGGYLFVMRPTVGNSLSRISGMTLLPSGSVKAPIVMVGTCTPAGCPNIRIDHITLPTSWLSAGLSDASTVLADNVFGVIDHNLVGDVPGAGNGIDFVNVNHSSWQGVGVYGDNSWFSPNTFGSNQALYLEDNTFNYAFGTDADGSDSYSDVGGGRVVCRFNTFNNVPQVSACGGHGTETTGRPRGIRQAEFYGNTVTAGSGGGVVGLGMRSGVGIVFGNTYTNANHALGMSAQRLFRPTAWPQCNGLAPYDVNDGMVQLWSGTTSSYSGNTLTVSGSALGSFGPGGGKIYVVFNQTHGAIYTIASVLNSTQLTTGYYSGQQGGPFYGGYTFSAGDSIIIYSVTLYSSGTATSSGASLTDGAQSWTTNQWAGYNITDITQGFSGQIASSTANTASYGTCPTVPNTGLCWGGWHSGDAYIITRATRCLDQPSSFGGSLITGEVPGVQTVAQTLSPSYQFADGNVTQGAVQVDGTELQSDRDYYFTNASFNGTSGTGSGLLASRPAACTPGVGYWAKDQGNWNQSTNGFGNGQLYVCTAPNVWGLYYTPYTYPHPLIQGITQTTGGGNPPTNIVATSH